MNNRIHEGPDDLFFWYRNEFAEKAVDPQILGIESLICNYFVTTTRIKDLNILYLNRVLNRSLISADFLPILKSCPWQTTAPERTCRCAQAYARIYSYESSGTCAMAILCGSPVVALTAPGYEKYAILTKRCVTTVARVLLENTPEAIDARTPEFMEDARLFLVRRARSQQQFENFVTFDTRKGRTTCRAR